MRAAQMAIVILICGSFVLSCATKEKPKEVASDAALDSMLNDQQPVKLMADTITVSPASPLIITEKANIDSVQIFPYSLIFQTLEFDAFIVSFNSFSPALVTLDHEKKIIDSVSFFGAKAKGDNIKEIKHVRLTGPSDIILSDTIYRWELDASHQKIEKSKKTEVKIRKFFILSDGTIKKAP